MWPINLAYLHTTAHQVTGYEQVSLIKPSFTMQALHPENIIPVRHHTAIWNKAKFFGESDCQELPVTEEVKFAW